MQSDIRKPATLQQQVEILKKKGLIVTDEKAAFKALRRVNYYRLSAYTSSLKESSFNGRFVEGTSFDQIFSLYEFDKKFRNLLLGILETFEISLRSYLSYYFSHRYGSMGYLDPKNFEEERYHHTFVRVVRRGLARNDDLFSAGHRDQYKGNFPLWVVVEILSFGDLSRFYANMRSDDKRNFAKQYFQVPYIYLDSWLIVLSHVRNICAHYGRLYNRTLKYMPKLDKKDKGLGIRIDRVYASIFVLHKLSPEGYEWDAFVTNLQTLLDFYKEVVELPLIGFPGRWNELLE